MSEPGSPQTPVGESPGSDESYMARSMSTTLVSKHRRADRSESRGKAKPGSRLGKLDETMLKRVHSVSHRECAQLQLAATLSLRFGQFVEFR